MDQHLIGLTSRVCWVQSDEVCLSWSMYNEGASTLDILYDNGLGGWVDSLISFRVCPDTQ